jgi:hypothetical protein
LSVPDDGYAITGSCIMTLSVPDDGYAITGSCALS